MPKVLKDVWELTYLHPIYVVDCTWGRAICAYSTYLDRYSRQLQRLLDIWRYCTYIHTAGGDRRSFSDNNLTFLVEVLMSKSVSRWCKPVSTGHSVIESDNNCINNFQIQLFYHLFHECAPDTLIWQ